LHRTSRGRGLGGWLLRLAEAEAPADVESITLFTGSQSARNIAMYERAGFRRTLAPAPPNAVRLVKAANPGRGDDRATDDRTSEMFTLGDRTNARNEGSAD
jgi:GNAT superfamily N-acetyltransferase